MRLFIAIKFNNEFIDSIESINTQLINLGIKGRKTPIDNLHLTLAFIGECDTPNTLINVIDSIDAQPFDLALDKCSHFKDTVWVGTTLPTHLEALTKQLNQELRDSGYKVPNRDFIPHVTLFRKASNYEDILNKVTIPNTLLKVESISLMQSTLTNTGAIYKEIYTKQFNK